MTKNDDTMGGVQLPLVPEIVHREEAMTVTKDDGTKVSYYIFPEFEVHANTLPPGIVQNWHYHKNIEEIIFVTGGEVEVMWLDQNKKRVSKALKAGDLCRLGKSTHNVANHSKLEATFVVYRLVSSGKNRHELIKGDRYPVEVE